MLTPLHVLESEVLSLLPQERELLLERLIASRPSVTRTVAISSRS